MDPQPKKVKKIVIKKKKISMVGENTVNKSIIDDNKFQ